MKTYQEIMNDITATRAEIDALTNEEKAAREKCDVFIGKYTDEGMRLLDAFKSARLDAEYIALCAKENDIKKEIEKLRKVVKVLNSNAQVALYAETLPIALEVVNKYVGKRVGKKTEEKIRAEIYERTGIRFYYSTGCSNCWNFSKGYGVTIRAYFKESSMFNADGKLNEITEDMLIDPTADYIENPAEYVDEMASKAAAIKAAADKLNEMIDEYNGKAVEGFHHYDRLYRYYEQ